MKDADTGLLRGRVAVVTGGASGIGAATARLFAVQGAVVALFDINGALGQRVTQAITDAGGKAHFFQVDMTSGPAVAAAIGKVMERCGRLDIIVNVAGGSGRRHGDGPAAECTLEGWDYTLNLNLKTAFLGCKYAIPPMLAAGGGAVVNVASVLGLVGGDEDFGTHAYAASKGAVISLTRAIASYYARQRIRANVICPALIATPMSERAQSDQRILQRLSSLHPLTGAFGTPDDVAQAALYLASDQAAFVTGAVLTVDGGWTVR
jgi:NAD(P)-dependent dehydrogenase (short-subunit alcohol dehydrogenase family)